MAGGLLCIGLLLGALGGCDSVTVQSSKQVDNNTNDHELQINTESFSKVDLLFDAGAVPTGEALTIELIDDNYEGPVTRITHEGTSEGEKRLLVDFHPLNPSSVEIECRNGAATLYRDELDLPGTNSSAEWDFGMKVATTDDEPDSYHYSEEDGQVVLSVDYSDEQKANGASGETSVQFSAAGEHAQCSDVLFTLGGVSSPLSPEGVRFQGATQTPTIYKQEFE